MRVPNNLWEWLGAFGSAASLVGLAVAVWAEMRARRAERRAASAEERERAAVARADRFRLVREFAVASEAAKLCVRERASGPAWRAHFWWFRASVVRLHSSSALGPEEAVFVRSVVIRFESFAFRDPDSDRTLATVADRFDGLHGRLLSELSEPPR